MLNNFGKETRIPDLSSTPGLEIINLENCRSLHDINSSVDHLNNLCRMYLKGCENLRRFPSIHFKSSTYLDHSWCINLVGPDCDPRLTFGDYYCPSTLNPIVPIRSLSLYCSHLRCIIPR